MPVQSSPRSLWALTVLFGLATLVLGSWFSRVVPATGCAMPPQRGVTALLAFQMARTPADMEAVFGRDGDPCRPGMVAALDRANTVDLYGFIWTYGAFLLCFLLAIGRRGGGPAARLGIVALVAGLGLDVLETASQLRLTGELPGTASALQALAIGSTGKYIALSVVTLCAGVAMVARGRICGRLAGIACVAGSVAAVVGLLAPSHRALLTTGTAIAWVVILVYAAVSLLWRGRARRDALV
jgi:hypothetical protein